MSNKIKGVVAIVGGVTVLVMAGVVVYGKPIRQTANINPLSSSAKYFGGSSRNVQAPKLTQYGNVPDKSSSAGDITQINSRNTASLFFGGDKASCYKDAVAGFRSCRDGGGDPTACGNYWLSNTCDNSPGTCPMSKMGLCDIGYPDLE